MTQFVVRNSLTGEILRSGNCLLFEISLQAKTGEISEENTVNARDNTHYHDGAGYVAKLDYSISQDFTSITSDGLDTVTFTNIPIGTTVSIRRSGNFLVNDGILTYKSDIPGPVEFTFINFKYNTITLTVNVI